jgi:uncharacterized protein (TIGR03067 family)
MRTCGVVFGVFALLLGGVQVRAAKDEAKDEAKEMRYSYVSVVVDGKKLPKKELKDMVLIVKGNKGTVKKGDKVLHEGTSKMNMETTPWEIDIKVTAGEDKGKTIKGIMEMRKNGTMRVCFGKAGGDRPKKFASKKGSGHVLEVLKPIKAKDSDK